MMEPGIWRTVRPTIGENGTRELLRSAMHGERRLWCKQLWTASTAMHDHVLIEERYWAEGQDELWYRSEEALLASLTKPVEANRP